MTISKSGSPGYNSFMTLQGTIRGGLVVLEEGIQIPDGTKVSVFVPTLNQRGLSPEEEVARQKAALAELLAIADENPNDDFRAEDKDQLLYGGKE
jgi:hypothetical protein